MLGLAYSHMLALSQTKLHDNFGNANLAFLSCLAQPPLSRFRGRSVKLTIRRPPATSDTALPCLNMPKLSDGTLLCWSKRVNTPPASCVRPRGPQTKDVPSRGPTCCRLRLQPAHHVRAMGLSKRHGLAKKRVAHGTTPALRCDIQVTLHSCCACTHRYVHTRTYTHAHTYTCGN